MKTLLKTLTLLIGLAAMPAARADVLFSDQFNTNGPLLNFAPWTITGASVVNPIQVVGGGVVLTNNGQDVNAALSVTNSATSFYIGLTLNVTEAKVGDYFLHVSPAVGDTTSFFARLAIRTNNTATGFLLGYQEVSGTGSVTNYGSTTLLSNTSYRVVLAYNSVPGALNDTASIYVDPIDLIEANNTAYLTDGWTSATAEPTAIGTVNLRQGNAANAPSLRIDDLVVATTFAEAVAVVPEPSQIALFGLGALGLVAYRFRAARRR
jgi:hypothetical protein